MASALMLCVAASAHAVEEATLVDPQLHEQAIRFVSLSEGRLTYFDAERRLQTAPIEDFVQIRWERGGASRVAAEGSAARWPHVARLADGHVLRGRFNGVDPDGHIRWQTEHLGELTFTLEQLRSFDAAANRDGPRPAPVADDAAAGQDIVTLQNGDRLIGFVAGVSATGLSLEVSNQPLPLSWGGVRSVQLANPQRHTPGVWVRMLDGSRLRVDRLDVGSIQAIGDVFDRQVVVPVNAIAGVDFALRHRLVQLSELPPTVTQGGSVFGVPMPPRLSGDTVELHAPITVRFDLPDGVQRFAASASLDPGSLDWADLTIGVSDGRGQMFAESLNAERPRATINVAVRDGTLLLRVDTAANGPVLDRLTLTNAVLLITAER